MSYTRQEGDRSNAFNIKGRAMTQTKEEVISAAMNFPLGRVLDRYMLMYKVPLEEAQAQERELKRFLALCALGGAKARYGIGKPVDDLWHELILFTKIYTEFCEKVAGKYIHHKSRMPGASRSEADVMAMNAAFQADYLSTFGEAPPETYWLVKRECSHVEE
jgi:hypothetical protein